MSKWMHEISTEDSNLSEKERATLARLLLESLESEPDPEVEKALEKEINHRLQQIDAGEVELIPWRDIKKRLANKLAGNIN